MKWTIAVIVLLFAGCQATNDERKEPGFPGVVPGEIVAADSMRIPDELNTFYFTVKLVGNEHSVGGSYDVVASYGYNEATTKITLPQGGSQMMRPAIKKGPSPFSYIIGFYYGTEDTFYEYFIVSAKSGHTEMAYLKAYSFQ